MLLSLFSLFRELLHLPAAGRDVDSGRRIQLYLPAPLTRQAGRIESFAVKVAALK